MPQLHAWIQNSSATPEPQKSHLEDEKEQDETLNYSHTSQSISYLTEEDYRLDQTLNSISLDLELVKVLEIREALNTINPESSSNSVLN